MLAAASRAFSQIVSPPFRVVLLKSVGLTLLMLAAVWAALYATFTHFVVVENVWLQTTLEILTGLGLVIGLGFLVAPVTSLFAGLFLDEIAEEVERVHYPGDAPGRPMPLVPSLLSAARFTLLVIAVNIVVLFLILLPGVNVFAFFIANAYLLGREYFEMIAHRFHDPMGVRMLREEASVRVFLAGLVIAAVLAVPFLNLLTPLFATAFMVHIYKDVRVRRRRAGRELPA
ncbi:sulfate transporter family protein [Chthonobacter rhizosphaerae]|uniref:sulfate transporter family protein n=1 Tax=Chthonobacter rhizosphaerae TaxID=2735553 RepID=UPI0015EF3964|nr:sulfate transporter family protein [Chthonobacter rhizosphaerae]